METPTPRITKYVLIPMPRTDGRARRFRLAPVDHLIRNPSAMAEVPFSHGRRYR